MKTIWKNFLLSAVMLGAVSWAGSMTAKAVELADGRVAFNHPPDLVEATTRHHFAGGGSAYHFVIEVPDDAGESLGAVVLTPRDHARSIAFNVGGSSAHLEGAYANGPRVELSSVGGAPENPDELLVVFDDPIAPGETVTVTLRPIYNPRGGVYLFGVTAYPDGDNGVGQFLGYGRINIYETDT